jgi:hypothetical protein
MGKFMVEILVNNKPSIASSTEFRGHMEAEHYAIALCSEMKEVTAYRIFETGWGAPPRTPHSPAWIAAPDASGERSQFAQNLAESISAQDDVMMMDIAKVLKKMPEGSSVIAFRKYRGTVLAGLVVPNGDIVTTTELYGRGLLNPEGSPGAWRLIPDTKLNLLKEFSDPPEAALAFFVLSPSGEYAFALSHLVRSDGNLQWISKADYVCRVADVLIEAGLLQG